MNLEMTIEVDPEDLAKQLKREHKGAKAQVLVVPGSGFDPQGRKHRRN